MENRYLFKAKRVDNGKWEVGSLVILPSGKCEITNSCLNPPDSDPMWRECVITHIVDPSTICQCTGLRDKNGNLIWENDIVKGKYYDGGKAYEHMGQIEYDCQSYKVVGINQYKGYHAELDNLYETVGNIFDNPELLEDEKIKQEKEEDEYEL